MLAQAPSDRSPIPAAFGRRASSRPAGFRLAILSLCVASLPALAPSALAQRLVEPGQVEIQVEVSGPRSLGGTSGLGGSTQLLGGGTNAGLSVSLTGQSAWTKSGGLVAEQAGAPYALALAPVPGLVANAGGFLRPGGFGQDGAGISPAVSLTGRGQVQGPRNLRVLPGGGGVLRGGRGAGLAETSETIEPVFHEPGLLSQGGDATKGKGLAELPDDIAAFLATAKGADAGALAAFLASLPERFDGLGPAQRDAVLAGLESAAKADPKALPLRKALQDLIVRDELERVEPRLRGKPLTPARRVEVLEKTRFLDIRWWDHLLGKVVHPEAEGVAMRVDKSITLHVKKGWEKLPSFVAHYRALFSHEYTHRLQFEAEATEAYGIEIPAVATEVLRAIELVGLGGLAKGLVTFIGENQLGGFERGRDWMRRPAEGKADKTSLYFKGALAGAAYELALKTGRWADAWLYHREVSAGKDPVAVEQAILSGALTPLHHR